jgi:hypothetical protein
MEHDTPVTKYKIADSGKSALTRSDVFNLFQ